MYVFLRNSYIKNIQACFKENPKRNRSWIKTSALKIDPAMASKNVGGYAPYSTHPIGLTTVDFQTVLRRTAEVCQ